MIQDDMRATAEERLMALFLDGYSCHFFEALKDNILRLPVHIHNLRLKGVPIDDGWVEVLNSVSGDRVRVKSFFLNFELLGDENAIKARLVVQKLGCLYRAQASSHRIAQIIKELSLLGYEVNEEQYLLDLI